MSSSESTETATESWGAAPETRTIQVGKVWKPRMLATVNSPSTSATVRNAAFLTVALVLGEFTVANILGFETFPTWIVRISGSQPTLSVAVSILSLLLTWGLLLLISGLDRRRGTKETA